MSGLWAATVDLQAQDTRPRGSIGRGSAALEKIGVLTMGSRLQSPNWATDLLDQWLHDLQKNRTQETNMLCSRDDVPEEVRRSMSEYFCVRCTSTPHYIILRTISVIRRPGSIEQTASQKAANPNRQRCHFLLLTAAQKPNNPQIQNPHRAMSPSYFSEGF